jgi:hypothetical protein
VPGAEARRLAGTVGATLAEVTRVAAGPGSGLAGKGSPAVAFRQALARWSTRVRDIESALDRRDGAFFLLVDQGSADLGEVQVDWARTGSRSPAISAGLRSAAAAYRTLRSEYGREGVRQRQGGPLSAAEKAQLQRLQSAERRFAANLQALRDQARRHRDAVSAAELERFRAEAARIGKASLDLASYLNALIATSELRGEWSADAVHVRKSVPAPAMAAAEETVQDLYVDSDIGQVFTVDLGPAPGPAPAAAPAAGAEPVQAYEAAPAAGDDVSAPPEEETGGEPVEAMEAVPAVEPARPREAQEPQEEMSAAPPEEEEEQEIEPPAAVAPPPAVEPAPAPPVGSAPPPPPPPAESPVPPPIG